MSKTWFITGASRGLGKEIAVAALAAGENVVAAARNAKDVEGALAGASGEGCLLAVALDVTDENQTKAEVEGAVKRFGRIDVLVNNAGFGQMGFFETLTPEQMRKQFDTNVFGLFNVTRAVLPQMRAQRSGLIFNLSSLTGVVGFGGACAYTSSKFAVEGFSEDNRLDLARFGIHVTLVEPGFFRTDFLDPSSVKYGDVEIEDYVDAVAEQRANFDAYSHRQLGDPRKLARALLKIAAEKEPPLRIAFGTDAVRASREALEKRLAELDRWREISESTDHDDAT